MNSEGFISLALAQIRAAAPELKIEREAQTNLFGDSTETGAVFSPEEDPVFRYLLWRVWDANLPLLLVIMLNPSTADHKADDRTIMTLTARAKADGYGGIIVINLFAFRATSPADMKKAKDPIGPQNDKIVDVLLDMNEQPPLCAWGSHGTYMDRGEELRCRLEKKNPTPLVLKMSKEGQPEHPLYKSMSEKWYPWPGFRSTS